jgi:UDP-2,4-diacetamido-2,4,6-trideoxy-beta-L-altropyranose hydrolase
MMNTGGCLLVRADASAQIGTGHVMRCLALAKAWQTSGGKVTFFCAELLPALEQRLREEGIEVITIEVQAGTGPDMEQTAEFAKRLHATWLVVDGYQFGPDYYRQLRLRGLRTLAVDDDARFSDYCADIVLNQNAAANEAMYQSRQPYTKVLLGSSFVLLRPEFLGGWRNREMDELEEQIPRGLKPAWNDKNKGCLSGAPEGASLPGDDGLRVPAQDFRSRVPELARKLLITLGGSDPENVTRKVVQALAEMRGEEVEVRVVLGSGYSHAAALRPLLSSMNKISLVENPPNMVPLMAWADLAISAAGGTCWELAYMGLPAVVMAISRGQLDIAQAVADRGVAHSLGWHADVSGDEIQRAVRMLLHDSARRASMSRAGRELVDGQGPKRVVDFLRSAA